MIDPTEDDVVLDDLDTEDPPAQFKREGPLKILFVDDEARILRALKALFRDHKVTIENDPKAAVELARHGDFDVVVCDQRMPGMEGIDVLRQVKDASPRAMRILLTGYSDLKAVLGSVNEGEVFRFVNKPWNNTELKATISLAGEISRDAPSDLPPVTEAHRTEARQQAGVLVIDDNPETQSRLREILAPHYQVRFATTPERALEILEQHETGVVISETETSKGDMTALLKALKRFHPHIPTVVITERANAQMAIELINEGQVYRLLLKPIRLGTCRLSVDSAISRYWALKQNPAAARRYAVHGELASTPGLAQLGAQLLQRIRTLPARLLGVARTTSF
jgi:DNA-binding NtrC family response regulator